MKGILTSYKVNEKYLPFITCAVIAFVIGISLLRFPFGSPPIGDEEYYRNEVAYMAGYGLYNSLCQGTSFFYTLLVYICSKVCFTDFVTGGRILSVLAFLAGCRVLYLCTGRITGLSVTARHVAVLAFSLYCYGWLWKSLADIVSVPFVFGALYMITGKWGMRNMVMAALLIFVGFVIKPTNMFILPGMAAAILVIGHQQKSWLEGFVKSCVFGVFFVGCFVVYHLPGYKTYGKVMLENKSHNYVAGKRIENSNKWYELIVYYEQYNPNHRANRWQVTWGELDTFMVQHPEIDLHIGYIGYIKKYTASYFGNIGSKLFLALPYSIQNGFFFAKWTVLNRFIHSFFIIKLLTLLLIGGMFYAEIDFVRKNLLWLLVPFSYYLILSVYIFAQMEENWLMMCVPLLALPVVRFLSERVNILLLAVLQVVYLLL